jgi:hypothetical protein
MPDRDQVWVFRGSGLVQDVRNIRLVRMRIIRIQVEFYWFWFSRLGRAFAGVSFVLFAMCRNGAAILFATDLLVPEFGHLAAYGVTVA